MRAAAIATAAVLALSATGASADVQLAGVLGDHMVLQRDRPIRIWGTAAPGEAVQVQLKLHARRTTAGADGRWTVQLPALPAGGPYELIAQGNNRVTLNDVLLGDVWLCSGQSNMEWTLAQSQDGPREVAAADHPLIRHIKVPRRASLQPQADMTPTPWQASSPATAGAFSAVAYHFAVQVQTRLAAAGKKPVPIGLVNASWGGSHIETWTSRRAALADPVLAAVVQGMPPAAASFAATQTSLALAAVRRWQGDLPLPDLQAAADAPEKLRAAWASPALDDQAWPTLNAPQVWEEQGLPNFDGTLWMRRSVTLSAEQAAGAAVLHLGAIDDCDETWINGHHLGGQCQWDAPRRYIVPAGWLQAGNNVIAVQVDDTGGGGGFHGAASAMQLETLGGTLPLHGAWRARVQAPMHKTEPAFNDLPTLLFNGMLQPLLPLQFSGVLWYQGESNVPRAARYAQDFQRLITDWRTQWRQPRLPFLWVQLAAFLPLEKNSLQGSGWAELRDAQRQALALPATGMVVATDVGDAHDIHPRNKRAVGERLAAWAQRLVYGPAHTVASGPVLRGQRLLPNGQVELQFDVQGDPVRGGHLAARGGGAALQGFAVAGADRRFVPARAEIQGRTVRVWHESVPQPRAVRYAWVNNPEQANLVNNSGLPASPFRTDRWPLLTEGALPPF